LISLRSRGSLNRPFTRLEELEARAGRQWEAKLKELQSERESTQQKINELQAGKQGSAQQQMILTPEQQKALAKYQQDEAQAGKELRQVQKNLRKDTDSLEAWIRVLNIGAMPALVALSGIVLAVVKHKRTAAK
jgi:seryl-tRNA synthetase